NAVGSSVRTVLCGGGNAAVGDHGIVLLVRLVGPIRITLGRGIHWNVNIESVLLGSGNVWSGGCSISFGNISIVGHGWFRSVFSVDVRSLVAAALRPATTPVASETPLADFSRAMSAPPTTAPAAWRFANSRSPSASSGHIESSGRTPKRA